MAARPRAVLGLLLVLLAGCGASPLDTRELRSQATRMCTLARRQTDRIAVPASPEGGGAFLSRGIAVLDPELKGLRALRPPRDLAQVYATSLSAFAQKLAALHSTARALARGGDPVIAIKTLQQQIAPLETEEDGAWQALGIPACLNH